MLSVNAVHEHIATRLLDFFGSNTAWYRALWGPGLVLTLKELIEASEAVRAGVLSDSALHYLTGYTAVLIGRDPGAGTKDEKRRIQQALKSELRADGLEYRVLKTMVSGIESNYLERWSRAVDDRRARSQSGQHGQLPRTSSIQG